MQRKDNWEKNFYDCLKEMAAQPWKWGQHDCAIMAANVIMAMTGVDLAEKVRGKYKTKRGAAGLIARAGGLVGLIDCEIINPTFAQRGDLCLIDDHDGEAFGICVGKDVIQAAYDGGYHHKPMKSVVRSWAIGR